MSEETLILWKLEGRRKIPDGQGPPDSVDGVGVTLRLTSTLSSRDFNGPGLGLGTDVRTRYGLY